MTSEEIHQGFQKELLADGKSPKTIISYAGNIKGFVEWLGDRHVDFDGNISRFYVIYRCPLYIFTSMLRRATIIA